jgi:hypothetical protein
MRLICPIDDEPMLTRFCQEHFGISPVFKQAARWQDSAIYVLDQRPAPKRSAQE